MNGNRPTARSLLILYLLMGIPAFLNLMYFPGRFIVAGDAAATARNITAAEFTYRLGILSGLVSLIAFLFLASSLYQLFQDVDRKQARLLVILVSVSVALGLVTLVHEMAPLILLSGAGFLSAFTGQELETLAFGSLRLRGAAIQINTAFWGLWLLPFGILAIKSGFIPRLIGVLLIVGCFAYLAVSVTAIVFPAYWLVVNQVALPFYGVGELSVVVWLFVKAVRGQPLEPRPT